MLQFFGLIVILASITYPQLSNADDFGNSVLEKAYFYLSLGQDTLFLAYKFNKVPNNLHHLMLEENSAVIVEFHRAVFSEPFILPGGMKIVDSVRIDREFVNDDIMVARAILYLNKLPFYEFNTRGNFVILAFDLVNFIPKITSEPNDGETESSNILESHFHTSSSDQLKLQLNFKKTPTSRIKYIGNKKTGIIYDFYNVTTSDETITTINKSPVIDLVLSREDRYGIKRTRFKINTFEAAKYTDAVLDNTMIISFDSEGWEVVDNGHLNSNNRKWISIGLSVFTIVYGVTRVLTSGD